MPNKEKKKSLTMRLSDDAKKALDSFCSIEDRQINKTITLPYRAVIQALLQGMHPSVIHIAYQTGFLKMNILVGVQQRLENPKRDIMRVEISSFDINQLNKVRIAFYDIDFEKTGRAIYPTKNKAIDRLLKVAFAENEDWIAIQKILYTEGEKVLNFRE